MSDIVYTNYEDAEEGLRHLRAFRDATVELCKQANTVYRTEELECIGSGAKELSGLKRMSDASDLSFYSLAPVYVGVGGDLDILDGYAQMCSPELQAVVYVSDPVFAGLDAHGSSAWNHRIDAVDTTHFTELTKYLSTEALYRDKRVIRIGYTDLRFPDPIARSSGAASVEMCDLRVFFPFSRKGAIRVHAIENGLLKCELSPISAHTRAELRKLELAYATTKENRYG